MKTRIAILLLLLASSTLLAQKTNTVHIKVNFNDVVNQMKEGIGCNFHAIEDSLPVDNIRTYAGSVWGANPQPNDTASWNKIFGYCDWIGFDWARLGFTLNMWEPERNTFTPNNKEMKILYTYLDYFQKNNIDVYLQHFFQNTNWLTPEAYRNNAIQKVRSAPNDINAFTDGLIALLKHLTKEKGYTCIKQIGVTNEPFENWSWYMKSFKPDVFESPMPAMIMMKEKLQKEHLNVQLTGPDISWFIGHPVKPEAGNFFNTFDAVDFHQYISRYDWYKDSLVTIDDGILCQLDRVSECITQLKKWKQHCAEKDKPLFLSELGSFMYGFNRTEDKIISYPALLKDMQTVMRYSNFGVDGFARWNFINRGNLDGPWQMINTWNIAQNKLLSPKEFTPNKVPFYMWSALTRYTSKKSFVVNATIETDAKQKYQRVFATTYVSPSKSNYTIYIMNDSDETYNAEINLNNAAAKTLYKYVITDDNVSNANINTFKPESSIKTAKTQAQLTVTLPPKSVVFYTTYKLLPTDKGIVND